MRALGSTGARMGLEFLIGGQYRPPILCVCTKFVKGEGVMCRHVCEEWCEQYLQTLKHSAELARLRST